MDENRIYYSLKEIEEDENFPKYFVIDLSSNEIRLEVEKKNHKIFLNFDVHMGLLLNTLTKKLDKLDKNRINLFVLDGLRFKGIKSFNLHPDKYALAIENSNIHELKQVNYTCTTKVSIRSKSIIKKIDLQNIVFKKLFEIYDSTVTGISIFNKVDFEENVVFTLSKFRQNILFTYSTFEKLGIFSRAKFLDEKNNPTGLDLSQSIINGNLTFFETNLKNYSSEKISSESDQYDIAITEIASIPNQNKRETFRIIKHQLIEQNNQIEAENYLKLEKQSFLEEKNLEAIYEDSVFKTFGIILNDYIVLKLNKYSNGFKTSWRTALIFTLFVAFISHFFLQLSDVYRYTLTNYFRLINPVDFSFYNMDYIPSGTYIGYFIAKIFIGYGIYQFIQAFRKFK
jgi:hypothetical protein